MTVAHCAYLFSPRPAPQAKISILLQFSTWTIQISIAANSTYKKLKRAVGKQLKAREVPHLSFRIRFGGKVLHDNFATLADLWLISGTTVQVDLYNLRGGGGPEFAPELREMLNKTPSGKYGIFSITREGMSKIFPGLLDIAKEERGFNGDDVTSHDCAALFQGKSWRNGAWTVEAEPSLQFHPMDRFRHFYCEKMPDRTNSCAWGNFGLIRDLPSFLDECERVVPPSPDGGAALWLDILFTDYNSPDIKVYQKIADGLCSGAELHFAFLCGGMVSSARCNAAIATRFLAGLKARGLWGEGQDRTDAVVRGGELLREGDRAFTTCVTVQGRTEFETDVMDQSYADRFGSMRASDDADDLTGIRGSILEAFGTAAAFNFAMAVIRNAVLLRYCAGQPTVRRARLPRTASRPAARRPIPPIPPRPLRAGSGSAHDACPRASPRCAAASRRVRTGSAQTALRAALKR